jgi:membrane-associated phospholipid phosphatase
MKYDAGLARQTGVYAAAYGAYGAARWAARGDPGLADSHAHRLFGLERRLGIAVEPAMQALFGHGLAARALSVIYVAAQIAVVPAALLVAYRRSRGVYRRLRNIVLLAWMLALPVFWLYPVAPPRLARLGITDTIASGAALNSRLATSLYNPLAAMPSLHCGFALAVSLASWRLARTRLGRWVAASWAPLVILSVIATGNHVLVDVVGGLAVTLVAAGAVVGLQSAPRARWRTSRSTCSA